ncbi:hypothetical protein [Streptomyces sp. B6B3]|uniref:hypothetical protein n=1 Tax=Streptomyces sp. B6B3 TaxID=3153570 RepID=UPI00325F3DBE
MDAQPGPQGQLRSANRRPLISGMVAAGVLCLGWLIPSAYADGDEAAPANPSTVAPADEPAGPGAAHERQN